MRAQPDAELRAARLADLRRQIAADVYATDGKLSAAIDGLLDDVCEAAVDAEQSPGDDGDASPPGRRPR
jgi:hypothetical protein